MTIFWPGCTPALIAASVDAGAFLWRGSLRPGSAPLRTVQLFFEVRDTQLAYHPDWPALADVQGTVLIDDTNVSVWADRAYLYDTAIEALSAEAWRDSEGDMRLVIAASLAGTASDGLQVLNQSPAGAGLQGALAEWQAEGSLQADIRLQLLLSQLPPPPTVELRIAVADTSLAVNPGKLLLEGVNGTLFYDSATGFRAEQLTASLWQQPLSLALRQLPAAPDTGGGGAGPLAPVQLVFAADIRAEALRAWLGPTLPPWVSGATAVSGSLDFVRGRLPQLQLNSNLRGLALDLPATWAKPVEAALPFKLQAELGARPLLLELSGGRRWHAQLSIGENGLEGAALGLQDRSLPLIPGQLRVSGHAALLDVAAWQALFADLPGIAGERQAPGGLRLRIEQLLIDSLQLQGRDWRHVLLDLEQEPDHWLLALETDWVQGELVLDADFASARLDLAYLDLSGLGPAGDSEFDPSQFRHWPGIKIDIADLQRGSRRLGHLAFALQPDGGSSARAAYSGRAARVHPFRRGSGKSGLECGWHQPAGTTVGGRSRRHALSAWLRTHSGNQPRALRSGSALAGRAAAVYPGGQYGCPVGGRGGGPIPDGICGCLGYSAGGKHSQPGRHCATPEPDPAV